MGTRDIAPSLVQSRLYSKQNLSLEPVKGGGNFVTFAPSIILKGTYLKTYLLKVVYLLICMNFKKVFEFCRQVIFLELPK